MYPQQLLIKQQLFSIFHMNYHAFQAKEDKAYSIFGCHTNKKQKHSFYNYIDIVEVQVPHLCIGVPTRADKPESPYLKPIIDEFEMDISGKLSASWKV